MRFVFLLFLGSTFNTTFSQKGACEARLLLNGYKNGDTLSKKILPALTNLSILYPCDNTISNQIIAYEFTLSQGGVVESVHGFTNELTAKILSKLAAAGPGAKIFIDMVLVKKRDGSIGHVTGLTLTVAAERGSVPLKIDTSGLGYQIPDCRPVPMVGKFKSGASITKNQLNLVDKVSAYNTCNTGKKHNGCSTDIFYKIVSFKATTIINGTTWSIVNSGAEFPADIRDQYKDLKVPAQLVISNIKAKYTDDCAVELPDVTLTINPSPGKATDPGVNNQTRFQRKK